MAKTKTVFICNQCGYESAKWYGKCPTCGEWDSMNEEQIITEKNKKNERTVKSGVLLSINTLQMYLNDYPSDGGCNEGPSYWGASCLALFDCVEMLYEMSGGKMNFFGEPILRNMLDYIEKVYIGGKRYVNFSLAQGI